MADFSLGDAIMDVLEQNGIEVRCCTDDKNRTYTLVDLYPFADPDEMFCICLYLDPKDIDRSFVDGFYQYVNEKWPLHRGRDISLKKRYWESEFLNNVSHDLQKALIKTKELEIPTEEEKADSDGLSLD